MQGSSLQGRIGKIVRAPKTHLLRKAAIETLEKRVMLTLATPTFNTPTTYGSEVDLSWSSVSGAAYYQILRSDPATPTTYNSIATVTGSDVYADTNNYAGLDPNSTYHYEVVAWDYTDPPSDASSPLAVTTSAFSATAQTGWGSTTLNVGYSAQIWATSNDLDQPAISGTWGDGASIDSTNASQFSSWPGQTQYATAFHTYASPGYYEAQMSLTDSNGETQTGDFDIDVYDTPASVSPVAIEPTVNQSFTATVANFADLNPSATAGSFTASINWGDGSSASAGTITAASAGTFNVGGTHTYTATGTHTVTITVTDAFGTSGSASSNITTHLPAPTGLTTTATYGSEIDLAWNAVSGATSYNIYRGTTTGNIALVDNVTASSGTTYNDTNLNVGLDPGTTYYYQVTAVDSAGNSPATSTLSATTSAFALSDPWNNDANVAGEDYSLSVLSNDLHPAAASVNWGDGTTSVVSNYQNWWNRQELHSDDHVYSVPGEYTATVSVTDAANTTLTQSFDVMIAPDVANVTATAVSPSEIDLEWSLPSYTLANAAHLEVDRSTDGVNFTALSTTLSPTATSYNDTGLLDDTHYWYRVRAQIYDGSYSAYSNIPDAWTQPAAATPLTATVASVSEIDLSWPDLSATAPNGINVYRSTDDATFTLLTTTPLTAAATSYNDTGLAVNTHYWYRISSISGSTVTPAGSADAYTLADVDTLSAAVASNSEIDLSWNLNVTDASAVQIYRSTDGINYSFLANASSGAATTYADTGLADNTLYYYQVRVVDSGVDSSFTDPASGITLGDISDLTATAASTTSIALSWTLNVTNATMLAIYRSVDGDSYEFLTDSYLNPSLTATSTSFIDSTLTEGHNYSYILQASGPFGTSNFSIPADASALPIQNFNSTPTTTRLCLTDQEPADI